MASDKKPTSTVQYAVMGFVVLIAAAAGVYLGELLGQTNDGDVHAEINVFSNLTLSVGMTFPNVEVTDRFYELHSTSELLHEDGTVVLFMDDDCAPCGDMVPKWESLIAAGVMAPEQIVGITFDDAVHIEDVHNKYKLSYSLYADEDYAFLNDFGIDGYPLVIVVDRDGVIREIEPDSQREFTAGELTRLMASN